MRAVIAAHLPKLRATARDRLKVMRRFEPARPARDGDALAFELKNRCSCLGLDWGDPAALLARMDKPLR